MGSMPMRIIFALMDGDGDGTVSLQEFQAAHEKIFKAMDSDKDGTLTLEEMQTFMRGTGKSPLKEHEEHVEERRPSNAVDGAQRRCCHRPEKGRRMRDRHRATSAPVAAPGEQNLSHLLARDELVPSRPRRCTLFFVAMLCSTHTVSANRTTNSGELLRPHSMQGSRSPERRHGASTSSLNRWRLLALVATIDPEVPFEDPTHLDITADSLAVGPLGEVGAMVSTGRSAGPCRSARRRELHDDDVDKGDNGGNRRSSSAWQNQRKPSAGLRWPAEARDSRAPATSASRHIRNAGRTGRAVPCGSRQPPSSGRR